MSDTESQRSENPSPSGQCKPKTKQGCLVAVVGPSGVGKDSILRDAKIALQTEPRVQFATRVITRPLQADAEIHQPVDHATFEQMSATGEFAVQWRAHDCRYGLQRETAQAVAAGAIVIINGSRAAIAQIRASYARCSVVWITAPSAVLAARLNARGRELPAQQQQRLDRQPQVEATSTDLVIDNSGTLEHSVAQLTRLIQRLLGEHG